MRCSPYNEPHDGVDDGRQAAPPMPLPAAALKAAAPQRGEAEQCHP
jgi:hypothetical protein